MHFHCNKNGINDTESAILFYFRLHKYSLLQMSKTYKISKMFRISKIVISNLRLSTILKKCSENGCGEC